MVLLFGLLAMAALRCGMIAFVEVSSFGIGTSTMYLSTVHPLLLLYTYGCLICYRNKESSPNDGSVDYWRRCGGLMAAGAAAHGADHRVVEHNPKGPGQKLLITGKGRCNVTNDCDVREFLNYVRHNPRFFVLRAVRILSGKRYGTV